MKTVSIKQERDESKEAASPYEQVALTIDENGAEHLMSTLTNLYSQPAQAVFREYVSNALDSHLKSGNKKPIQVTLKQSGYHKIDSTEQGNYSGIPYLQVQDFGVGMSKDEIVNVYSRYASSTKRDSNEQVGAFGLGAKSALAIADRFDVISIQNGQKLKFFIEKNKRGAGVVHFVSEETTNESNGVTLWIPLKENHYAEMLNFSGLFFATWEPSTVIFNGKPPSKENNVYNTEKFLSVYLGEHVLAWVSKRNSPRNNGGYDYRKTVNLSIAGISYKLDEMSMVGKESKLSTPGGRLARRILKYGGNVTLNLPIGSVDLTPSREEIMITERTIEAINTAYDNFFEQVVFTFESHMNTLKLKDAWNFYANNLYIFAPENNKHSYGRYYDEWDGQVSKESFGIKYYNEVIPHSIDVANTKMIEASNATAWPEKWSQINNINLYGAHNKSTSRRQHVYNQSSYSYGYTHIFVYGTQGKGVDNDETIIKRNARSYSLAKGADNKLVTIYHNNSEIAPDNKWLNAVMDVVHVNELEKIGKAYRSEQAKIAAAKRGPQVRAKAIFYTLTKTNGDCFIQKLSSQELLEVPKPIIIPEEYGQGKYSNHGDYYDPSVMDMWSRIPDFIKADQKLLDKDTDSTFYKLATQLPDNQTFVFVPANRSMNPVLKATPQGTFITDWLDEQLKPLMKDKETKAVMVMMQELINTYGSVNTSIIDIISKHNLFNDIVNTRTQRVFKELAEPGELSRLLGLAKAFVSFKPWGLHKENVQNCPSLEALVKSRVTNTQNRYELISSITKTHLHNVDLLDGQKLVALINTLDTFS